MVNGDPVEGVLARIGRPANPAESTLQLVRENPEVLERMSKNLFGHEHGIFGRELTAQWNALDSAARANWFDRSLAIIEENARTYVEPDCDDPDPDEELDVEPPKLRLARG